MELRAALIADLQALTDALDEPGTGLQTLLRALIDGTRSAVRAYLGLTITLVADGSTVTLTALDDDTDPASLTASVLVPLDPVSDAEPGSSIVFYAGHPGGFVDFAADIAFALGLPLTAVIVDQHLALPGHQPGPTDLSQLNQAIGILVAGGHPPPEAGAQLGRLAPAAQLTEVAVAQQLIQDAQRPRPEVA